MRTIDNSDRQGVLRAIRATLAASYACEEGDFLVDGVIFRRAEERPGRLRFPFRENPLLIGTMGAGVVVSCGPQREGWLRAELGDLERDRVFSATTVGRLAAAVAGDGQELVGPEPKFSCSRRDLRPASPPDGIELVILQRDEIPALYDRKEFSHALIYDVDAVTPDVLAVIARRGGDVVGVAAASADSDELWQIGVDVIAGERGGGIGRAMVGRLTGLIHEAGRVPYYSAAISNIRSRALAVSLGYWPVWTELYVRERRAFTP